MTDTKEEEFIKDMVSAQKVDWSKPPFSSAEHADLFFLNLTRDANAVISSDGGLAAYTSSEFVDEIKDAYRFIGVGDYIKTAEACVDTEQRDKKVYLYLNPIKEGEDFYGYDPSKSKETNSSDYFMFGLVKAIAEKKGVQVVPVSTRDEISRALDTGANIVRIDDVSYTGSQVTSHVLGEITERGLLDEKNLDRLSLHFVGTTESARQEIKHFSSMKSPKISSTVDIPTASEVLSEDAIQVLHGLYEKRNIKAPFNKILEKPLCITQFKVPDSYSLNYLFCTTTTGDRLFLKTSGYKAYVDPKSLVN